MALEHSMGGSADWHDLGADCIAIWTCTGLCENVRSTGVNLNLVTSVSHFLNDPPETRLAHHAQPRSRCGIQLLGCV